MTKRRDRYQSAFDGNKPGADAAAYDLMLALMLLEKYLRQHELLRERIQLADLGSWTLAQLLEIANDARRTSIDQVVNIYQRLQDNAERARLVREAHEIVTSYDGSTDWAEAAGVLRDTLDNKAIAKRGTVSLARRIIARRAKETGGDTA